MNDHNEFVMKCNYSSSKFSVSIVSRELFFYEALCFVSFLCSFGKFLLFVYRTINLCSVKMVIKI